MDTANAEIYPPQWYVPAQGATANVASGPMGLRNLIGGTGSVFEISQVEEWRDSVQARVSYLIVVGATGGSEKQRVDVRLASEHLDNIRQVLKPAIADLAAAFGVSRQAIYRWISGDATPEPEKIKRIRALSHAADAFRQAGVMRAPSLLKMKAFEGRSLLDLVAAGQLTEAHIRLLIEEARAMDAAYERSALAKSKAKPSDDWRATVSIPGSPER